MGSRLKCKISANFVVKFAGKWHQAEDYLGEIVINELYPIKDMSIYIYIDTNIQVFSLLAF